MSSGKAALHGSDCGEPKFTGARGEEEAWVRSFQRCVLSALPLEESYDITALLLYRWRAAWVA